MINKKLITYATRAKFNTDMSGGLIPSTSIVFIQDTGELWTHNKFFGGNFSSVNTNYGTLTLSGSYVNLSLDGHKHAYTDLTGSTTTANQAIVSNGTANGWTLATLGSNAFNSTAYLPLSGGTMTGALNFKNGTWNNVGDDVAIGDMNSPGRLCIKAISATNPGIAFYNNSSSGLGYLDAVGSNLLWSGYTILNSSNFNSFLYPLTYTLNLSSADSWVHLLSFSCTRAHSGSTMVITVANRFKTEYTIYIHIENGNSAYGTSSIEALLVSPNGDTTSLQAGYIKTVGDGTTTLYDTYDIYLYSTTYDSFYWKINSTYNSSTYTIYNARLDTTTTPTGLVTFPIKSYLYSDANSVSTTKLLNARTINGTSFDGTGNITTSLWGTARSISIGGTSKSVNGSVDVTWTLSEISANYATTAETASYANVLNVYTTNECIIHNGYSGNSSVWINYRGATGTGITEYNMGNGLSTGGRANVRANSFIGSLTGNADSATTATKITATSSTTTQAYLLGVTGTGVTPLYDPNIYITTTAGNLHATTFIGALTGTASNSTLFNGISSDYFVQGSNASCTRTAPVTWVQTDITQYTSGFWNISGTTWLPDTNWYWGLTMAHTSNSSTFLYGHQIASSNGTSTALIHRSLYGGATGTTGSWYTVLDSHNYTTYTPSINGSHGTVDGSNTISIYAPTSQLSVQSATNSYLVGSTSTTSLNTVYSNSSIYMNGSTLYASNFVGNITGNLTGSASKVSLHGGNEINIGGSLTSGRLHVNYSDGGSFTEYGFYGGGTTLANIYANTFYGTFNGTASLASTISANSSTTTQAYLLGATTSGTTPIYDPGIYITSTSGTLHATYMTATTFTGNLTGTATNSNTLGNYGEASFIRYRGTITGPTHLALGIYGWDDASYASNNLPSQYGDALELVGYSTWYHRLCFSTNGTLSFYQGINTTTMTFKGTLAFAENVPTKTGTGASGTWGISISGNAATASRVANVGIASSWLSGRDNAIVKHTTVNGYSPVMSTKTNNGSWEFGNFSNYGDQLLLTYFSDTNYNAGTNSVTSLYQFSATKSGTVAVMTDLPTSVPLLSNLFGNRQTSADITQTGSGGLSTFKATSTMTTSKPASDGHILHMYWDNTAGYDSQLFIGNGTNYYVQYRNCNAGTWGSWVTLLDSLNYKTYTVDKIGTGASGTWNININGSAQSLSSIPNGYAGIYGLTVNVSGTLYTNNNLTFNGTTNTLTAPNFSGALSGNATTATSASSATLASTISSNLSNTTQGYLLAQTSSGTTPFYDSGIYIGAAPGNLIATTFTGNLVGNASTSNAAAGLANTRTLWGQGFDGTGDVSGNISNTGNILPSASNTYTIGVSANYYSAVYASNFYGNLNGNANSATNIYVNYHSGNNVNYPIVWTNQVNTSNIQDNLLYKTTNNLYFNPSTMKLTSTGGFVGNLSGTSDYATYSTHLYTDGSTAGTSMTFHWAGLTGQPTWLWGGNSASDMYVYNPSNFSVNYATSSNTTNILAYMGSQTMDTSGTLTGGVLCYGVYNNGYPAGYGNVINIAGQGYGQLLIGWSGTTGAHADNYIRSLRDSAKGTNGWSDWAKILTSANYNTYALPLSGGTLTGLLTASAGIASTTGTFSSTLIVTGATTLSSTLGVSGATTISSTLGVSGLGTFSNGIYVTSGGININNSGVWFKSSDGSTVYSNITSNGTSNASWQVIDANGTEIWFGKRGGKRILSMVTLYDTAHNISTASYTTIGFGTSIAQRNYTLQVNGTLNTQDSIYSDGGLSVVGGITSSSGSLNVNGGVTAGGNVSANEGYFTSMVEAGGKVRAYGGNRGNILTLLFDGRFGYDTSTSSNVYNVYVNRTGTSNPTFARTAAGVYTLTFSAPTYISTILLCIVKDATNFFYVSSNVSTSGGNYIFTFKTANDNSLDDAAFRVSMLYELA